MGYDYTALYKKPTHKEAREFLDQEFTWTSETGTRRVLASTIKNNIYYAAVENTRDDFREVFAVIHIVSGYKDGYTYWFGGKSMDETMYPGCFDCPKKILDLLTPTENENANAWRQKCLENYNKPSLARLPVGTSITFKCPFDTSSGYKTGDEVTLYKKVRSRSFRSGRTMTAWTDGYYRWPNKLIPDTFEIVELGA